MGEARSKEAWAHTSAVLAMTANINRDPKRTKAFKPADFNPYEVAKQKAVTGKADISVLKDVFVKKEDGK
ncbi:MAG: hypothetical protein J7M19_09250 [Planctomycetes bacterium]|nr:hypothetical protein [Planctomycetota bacterium]